MKCNKPLLALSIIILALACEKKQTCDTTPYPPSGISIDWANINSVENVANYFQGHDSVIEQHKNEFLEVFGYIRVHGESPCEKAFLTSDSVQPYRYLIPLYFLDTKKGEIWDNTSGPKRLQAKILAFESEDKCHKYDFWLGTTDYMIYQH